MKKSIKFKRFKKENSNKKVVTASAICVSIVIAGVVTNSLYGEAKAPSSVSSSSSSSSSSLSLSSLLSSLNAGSSTTSSSSLSTSSSVSSSTSSSTSSSLSSATSNSSSSMSSQEMDKIISQISEAASSPDYEAILDQVIERAILMGNTELQQYAQNKKAIYAAQSQIAEQNAMNAALAAKNPDIQSVESKMSQIEASSVTNAKIIETLPQRAGELFSTLSDTAWASLSDTMASIGSVISLESPSTLGEVDKNVICAVLCQDAVNQGLFSGDDLILIENYQKAAMGRLQANEESKYAQDVFTKLKDSSQNTAINYNSVKSATPSQIILYNQTFTLANPVIVCNDTLMIAVDDAYQFIDARYEKSDKNATATIISENMRVELTAGKNIAYVNDKSTLMETAMLNFNNVYYIPAEFFANAYGVQYIYSEDSQCMIMYGNLNQLRNKTTANKLVSVE